MKKFIPFLFLFLLSFTSLSNEEPSFDELLESINQLPDKVYIDPDLGPITVTTKPGVTWKDCQVEKALCIAWPDSKSELSRIKNSPAQSIITQNPVTGERESIPYLEVNYKYTREYKKKDGSTGSIHQVGRGWIDGRVLRQKKLDSVFKIPDPPKQSSQSIKSEKCDPYIHPGEKNKALIEEALKQGDLASSSRVEYSAALLHPLVGQCPLNPPTEKKPKQWKNKHLYEHEVLPLFKKVTNKDLVGIKKEISPGVFSPMTKEDLIDIDTLARTIYSEMHGCILSGMQFPMAVAKVALNRSDLRKSNQGYPHFSGDHLKPGGTPPPLSVQPTLSRVLLSPSQFSVWNQSGVENPRDKTSLLALCPTKENNKKNWKGETPSADDIQIWNLSLKIATEAVLTPDSFKAKTKNVTQLYYTSKRNSYDGRKRADPVPTILGRNVESYRCMYLWEGR